MNNCQRYDLGHTLLRCLSLAWVFNKLTSKAEASLLNKSSSLARYLGVTKLTNLIAMILVTLCCAT
jgi:hypothetical protein